MACRVSFQATANTNVLTLFVQMGDGKFRSVSAMSTLCFTISRRNMTGRAGFGGSLDGLVCKHIHTPFLYLSSTLFDSGLTPTTIATLGRFRIKRTRVLRRQ
jgi:hypothetical protein